MPTKPASAEKAVAVKALPSAKLAPATKAPPAAKAAPSAVPKPAVVAAPKLVAVTPAKPVAARSVAVPSPALVATPLAPALVAAPLVPALVAAPLAPALVAAPLAPALVAAPLEPALAAAPLAPALPASPPPMSPPMMRQQPKMPGHMPGMHGRPQIAPRAMAAKETFVEGDYVVYPTHGVGKVERIATEEIAGHKLELIHITFEENRMTLRVPVSKARTAGLRKLATRKTFDDALALLKGRARIKRTMWSRRAQEYDAKINSGDPMAIAEVVRDLHRNAGQPDQSFSERQIYEAAMDRLAAELGALDKTDKATAAQKLADYLKSIVKGAAALEPEIEEEE